MANINTRSRLISREINVRERVQVAKARRKARNGMKRSQIGGQTSFSITSFPPSPVTGVHGGNIIFGPL